MHDISNTIVLCIEHHGYFQVSQRYLRSTRGVLVNALVTAVQKLVYKQNIEIHILKN